MQDLLRLSGLQIAKLIREKEITPLEAVDAHIAKIAEVNPRLNAMVEERFETARQEAREKGDLLMKGDAGPLGENAEPYFGVPFTVKEMVALTGMKRTAGSIHRRENRLDWDGSSVARLRAAGAIPVCTTNVPELGFWFESDNPVYGRTNNPYDTGRTAGGSSGGEGALIGAGASPFGIGSDIGGSIRMPASFCGCFGHKPTNRLVPLTGHFPYTREDMAELKDPNYPYTTIGVLSRKAEDLPVLLDLIKGRDGLDQETLTTPLKESSTPFSKMRVFTMASPQFHLTRKTDQSLQDCVTNAAKYFEGLGARVEELDPRMFVRGAEIWGAALKSTKPRMYEEILNPHGPVELLRELFQLTRGKRNYTFPSLSTVIMERAISKRLKGSSTIMEEHARLRRELDEKLGDDGILLFPPHSRPAPKHSAVLLSPFDFIYTGIFNALGNPATAVPMGLDDAGLPLGIQVVAGRFNDRLGLRAALSLEGAFGGWTPPRL